MSRQQRFELGLVPAYIQVRTGIRLIGGKPPAEPNSCSLKPSPKRPSPMSGAMEIA